MYRPRLNLHSRGEKTLVHPSNTPTQAKLRSEDPQDREATRSGEPRLNPPNGKRLGTGPGKKRQQTQTPGQNVQDIQRPKELAGAGRLQPRNRRATKGRARAAQPRNLRRQSQSVLPPTRNTKFSPHGRDARAPAPTWRYFMREHSRGFQKQTSICRNTPRLSP